MKQLFMISKFSILATTLMFSSFAFSSEKKEARVSIVPKVQGNLKAGKVTYSFQLSDSKTQKAVKDADLKETHTKLLHMIVYDASLMEFNHVHPEFVDNVWMTELNFQKNGTYFTWAEGKLNDGSEFSTYTKAEIVSGEPANPSSPVGDARQGENKLTVVSLAKTKVRAGKMTMLDYTVTRSDRQEPRLTPYLGAMAHVIAVAPNGVELIHVHPRESDKSNTGMIHATFPTKGDYRLWIQIVDRGELKTVPLAVTVLK